MRNNAILINERVKLRIIQQLVHFHLKLINYTNLFI